VTDAHPDDVSGFLAVRDVARTYHAGRVPVPVLDGVSFSVARGTRTAIVGASGAGKSTLLHILGGLDRPDGGRVVFDGIDLYGIGAGARTRLRAARVGFVFQSYHLLPEMDVLENVMLPAMAGCGERPAGADPRARALELLEAVGLRARAAHTPMELSGGEQQRVALARALMNAPDLVLADEPTGNLDDVTGGHVLDHLFAMTANRAHTLIVVTHSETLARRCDVRYRLRDRRVERVAD
jgi:predicted ABC-type transport system involved in lysophospholipase L1 biosynthesis ATPase subunit